MALAHYEAPDAEGDSLDNAHLPDSQLDLTKLAKDALDTGLKGYIHGKVPDADVAVFWYGDPLTKYMVFSLFSDSAAIKKQLSALQRHDEVQVWGEVVTGHGSQPHIRVSKLSALKKYSDATRKKHGEYKHTANIADLLKGKSEIEVFVHAIAREGKVLVVELGDKIVPVVLTNGDLTEDLYRGDRIKIHFKKQGFPKNPTHIQLDESVPSPIEMVAKRPDIDGGPITVSGDLIVVPKGPQTQKDVYSVQVTDKNGSQIHYALTQFDPKLSKELDARIEKVWNKHIASVQRGRNYLVNRKIKVTATGDFYMFVRNQAPLIVIQRESDLVFSAE